MAFIHAPVAYEPGGIGGLGQLTLSVELVHILGGVPQCQVAHAPYCACAANGELAFDREGGNRGVFQDADGVGGVSIGVEGAEQAALVGWVLPVTQCNVQPLVGWQFYCRCDDFVCVPEAEFCLAAVRGKGQLVGVGADADDVAVGLAVQPQVDGDVAVVELECGLGADLVACQLKRHVRIGGLHTAGGGVAEVAGDGEVVALAEGYVVDGLVEANADVVAVEVGGCALRGGGAENLGAADVLGDIDGRGLEGQLFCAVQAEGLGTKLIDAVLGEFHESGDLFCVGKGGYT